MMVYCYAFLKPIIFLRSEGGGLPVKVCIATLFLLFFISVSELFLPTSWMFLGIAYWYLDKFRANRPWTAALATSRTEAIPAMATKAKVELVKQTK